MPKKEEKKKKHVETYSDNVANCMPSLACVQVSLLIRCRRAFCQNIHHNYHRCEARARSHTHACNERFKILQKRRWWRKRSRQKLKNSDYWNFFSVSFFFIHRRIAMHTRKYRFNIRANCFFFFLSLSVSLLSFWADRGPSTLCYSTNLERPVTAIAIFSFVLFLLALKLER